MRFLITRFWRTAFVVTAICVAAGCAPRISTIGDATISQALSDEGYVTRDGAVLAMQVWGPAHSENVVIGVHGMNDYANAFDGVGGWLGERGMRTYAYDQRGFGRSGERGRWYGDDQMVEDLTNFVGIVRERHPQADVHLLGLSMGAAVVLSALGSDNPPKVDAVIIVAPAVWGWRTLNPLYKATLWVAAHTTPWAQFSGSGLEIWPSDNIEMLRAFSKDPLVIKETRVDAIYGLVTLMDRGYLSAEKVRLPTLVLYGAKDEVIPRVPVEKIIEMLSAHESLAVVYPNGYHMLLRDLQREFVWRDIEHWLRTRPHKLPSGHGMQ